jgi:hypothetical protein
MLLDPINFVSAAVHAREVTLADGKVHTLHFREVDAATYAEVLGAIRSKDETERKTAVAKLIAACVCNQDGTPALTEEQAARLKPAVSMAIGNMAFEVNPASYAGKD